MEGEMEPREDVKMPPVICCSQTIPHSCFYTQTHTCAVTRCDLAVNELVLDMKVSM